MNGKTTIKALAFIVAIAVLLFGGISITGAAAQSALPGDALYVVKTTIESTRLSLAQDAGDRAQMKLAFAEQRLTEISGLIRDGRYREIPEAVLAFEANINAAILELDTVAKSDPARAGRIAQEVTAALTRYAQTLSELAATAPDSVRPEVARALDTTQIANGLDLPSGNENTNDNGNDSLDDSSNTNANDNGDDNVNDNDNGDDRGNDNDDAGNTNGIDDNDNGNDNADDNSNDSDDNGNNNGDDSLNTNSSDDNGNDNGDDNLNTNSSNDNGNDSLDDNSNGGDHVNENGDDNGGDRSGSDDDSSDDNSGSGSGGTGGDDNNSGKGSGGDDRSGDDD